MTLLIGSGVPAVEELRAALGAELLALPDEAALGVATDWPWGDTLEGWRDDASSGPVADQVVVAAWPVAGGERREMVEARLDEWVVETEEPFARWFAALGVAVSRCADGGSIVAVIERPPPLDCAGWAAASAVADAAESMVRSLARGEGGRGVRVNGVTTPVRLQQAPMVQDPAPSLATYPGSVGVEVAGAVRVLLASDAAGITGTVVHADCGRSWR